MPFNGALADYRRAKDYERSAQALDEARFNIAVSRSLDAMTKLLQVPAPDVHSLATKVEIIRGEYLGAVPADEAEFVVSDLLRLEKAGNC